MDQQLFSVDMARGGKREKAGRPSTWKSGCKFEDTKLIRVPGRIAEQVLELAHKLDAGEVIESVTKSNYEVHPRSEVQSVESIRPARSKASQIQGIACPQCESTQIIRDGSRNGEQRYACRNCKRRFPEHLAIKTLDSVSKSNNLVTYS